MDKLGRLEVEQLKVTSTTPPADSGFYKIDETTMGVVGDLKFRHPKTGAMSSALTATTSAQGIANLPDPASINTSTHVYLSGVGVGGSYWYSDGTRWRPTSRVVLGRITAPSNGVAQTAAQLLAETRIQAGVLQNGDMLHIYNVIGKSGTSDSVQRSIKIGATTGAINGTLLIGANTAPGGTSRSYGEELYLQRESSTSLRVKGNGSLSLPFAGASTSPAATPITVANMDSQDVYLANTITMTSGAETPSQETWIVELIASG